MMVDASRNHGWTKQNTAPLPESRRLDGIVALENHRALVYAGAGILAQTRNFVLYLQLATLQFRDQQTVARWMSDRFSDFILQRPVALLQFRKMR
jgi:hypothetical protein